MHPAAGARKPRVQSCVTIPFDETLKTVGVVADHRQVYSVAFRSEFLEYPAFLQNVQQAVVTEFELKPGQQIIGVYGSFDTKSKLNINSQLLDYDSDQDTSMLAGIGFIVFTPLIMSC